MLAAALLALTGCADSDPRTVEGALGRASVALARRDSAAAFRLIDQRARHALAAIVQARTQAAQAIETSYPEADRASAISALGDAATVPDAVALFRLRCGDACLADLSSQVAAPVELREEGPVAHVKTARGNELTLYRGKDGFYGLVWHTEELSRERDRAAAELELVQKNAALYQKQQALR
jgi:hypothetical protein